MFRKRRPFRRSQVVSPVADVLTVVGNQLNLSQKAREWAVLALFEELLEPRFQGQVQARRLVYKGQRCQLQVRVAHSVLAAELAFSRDTLRDRLNAYTPETGIHLDQVDILASR